MMNYKAIEKLLTGETEKESKVIRPEVFKDQTAYNTVMNNCQRIGGKRFCCIPLELLEIDEDYQRVYCINMEKVYSLVRKWDFNKCEPILVSPHPETATFAVIDGSHRCWQQAFGKRNMLLRYLQKDYLWILWKGK